MVFYSYLLPLRMLALRSAILLGRRAVAVSTRSIAPIASIRALSAVTKGEQPLATDLASILKKEIEYESEESTGDSQLTAIAQNVFSTSGFKVDGSYILMPRQQYYAARHPPTRARHTRRLAVAPTPARG